MFKKLFFLTITIIFLALLAIWSPWNGLDFSLLEALGLQQDDSYSGLQVYSMGGELEVSIDEETVGNVTVEGSPLEIYEIEPGEHLIQIRRISEGVGEDYYFEFSRMTNFVEGINTVIAYELGPTEEFSGGYVIYATPAIAEEQTNLNIRTIPEESSVFINELEVAATPINNYELDLDETYEIKIENSGTESIEFNLLPDDPEQRNALRGYDLNVEAQLFQLPVEIRKEV